MNIYDEALQRLCKWRSVLAGWQLGTRTSDDPECQAVRDLQEARLMLRVEVTALARVLVEKGITTPEDLQRLFAEEAEHLNLAMERKFPGFRATNIGMSIDPKAAAETMRGWKR